MREAMLPFVMGCLVGFGILHVASNDSIPEPAIKPDSTTFAQMAKVARSSVVKINSLVAVEPDSYDNDGIFSSALQKLKSFFFQNYTIQSTGSGVVISKRGHIVTNYHVIANAEKIIITPYASKKAREAALTGVDSVTGLAVIKVSLNQGIEPAVLTDSSYVSPGQWVAAIGATTDRGAGFSVGVVSARGRAGLGLAELENFIQADLNIAQESGGGALYDIEGELVGINIATFGPSSGITFAIPSNIVKTVAQEIIRYGAVKRGRMGVSVSSVGSAPSIYKAAPGDGGVLVMMTEDGAPAHKAGIRMGDVILTYNGKPVDTPGKLRSLVLQSRAGDIAEIKIVRDSKTQSMRIRLDEFQPDRQLTSN